MPSFSIYWHQNKEKPYHEALLANGWDFVPLGKPADILLVNHDMPQGDQRKSIDYYQSKGAKIVVYPEGSGIYAYWDGIREPYKVDACLVLSEGYKQVMDKWQLNVPIHVVGWSWSDIRPFTPTTGKKVLFAPIHPDGFGVLEPGDIVWNRDIYAELLKLDIDLTVRYLGELAMNGLRTVPNVTFKRGIYDNGNHDIESADVVVSTGTYAAKAVAMGKPTVMYPVASGETIYRYAKRYRQYSARLKYPLTVENAHEIAGMMSFAKQGVDLEAWKQDWIGTPFDGKKLDEILRGLLDA